LALIDNKTLLATRANTPFFLESVSAFGCDSCRYYEMYL